jgi:hypothetical protein
MKKEWRKREREEYLRIVLHDLLDIVVHQLDVVVHQLDVVVHQLDVVVHQLDVVVHQLDVVVHQLHDRKDLEEIKTSSSTSSRTPKYFPLRDTG